MKTIPNHIFFEEVEKLLLEEKKPVKITVQGTSMSPYFKSGIDYVIVSPPPAEILGNISRGDIVLFHIGDSVHLHRIIHYFGTLLEIRGDGCYGKYEKITASDIIGIVTGGTYRGGRPFDASSTSWKIRSYIWMKSYFIRHQLIRVKRVLRKTLSLFHK